MTRTTILQLALCAVGGLGLLLPWTRGFAVGDTFAFLFPQGGALAILLLGILVHVYATSARHPLPWWRPLGTAVLGLAALVVFELYAYQRVPDWPRYAGPWTTLVAILALTVSAADELRRALRTPRGE